MDNIYRQTIDNERKDILNYIIENWDSYLELCFRNKPSNYLIFKEYESVIPMRTNILQSIYNNDKILNWVNKELKKIKKEKKYKFKLKSDTYFYFPSFKPGFCVSLVVKKF